MSIYNYKILNRLNGGGNFADARLATTYYALTKGRLSSYMKVVIVLFVFILSLTVSSCSSDNNEEDNKPAINYKAELTAHEWEIFKITSQTDGLVLMNEDWMLVLKNK